MDPRIGFFQNLISDKTKRILELGPLNRPIADKAVYPNAFYCDIRSTEEVRKLYSGNDYLAATGISVNPETILPIDLVVHGSYSESLKGVEKFDYVIASHVLEHTGNLIYVLQDISKIMSPGGVFYIVYPDKRYCFDHFRTSASFRDAYNVFRHGIKENAAMVFDFYYSVIPENNPAVFWAEDDVLHSLPRADFANAVGHYEQALNGAIMDDVHYWPFTDMDFLKFLYDCTRAKLLPYRCIAFQPCAVNDQQFMLALQFDNSVLKDPEYALSNLKKYMQQALPYFYSNKTIDLKTDNFELQKHLQEQISQTADLQNSLVSIQNELNSLYKDRNKLGKDIALKEGALREQLQTVDKLKTTLADSKLHEHLQGEEIKVQLQIIESLKAENDELKRSFDNLKTMLADSKQHEHLLSEEIKSQLQIIESLKAENDELKRSLDSLETAFADSKQHEHLLSEEVKSQLQIIESLKAENDELKRSLDSLETALSDSKQHEHLQSEEIKVQLQVIESLKAENDELKRSLFLQCEVIDKQNVSIDELAETLREQKTLLQTLNYKADEYDSMRREHLQQVQILQQRISQLETIENSTIWRMTRPLRKILDWLKNIGRRKK